MLSFHQQKYIRIFKASNPKLLHFYLQPPSFYMKITNVNLNVYIAIYTKTHNLCNFVTKIKH